MNSYHDPQIKKDIQELLTNLNQLLRDSDFSINFINGTLHHNYKGFCGALEDDKNVISLLDDDTGIVIYETEKHTKT